MSIKIKDIPKMERPRERLINNGASALSNDELLAVILKDGTKGKSSKEISLDLLKEIDNINELKNLTYEQLVNIKGIGPAKACLLLAVFELNKRMNMNVVTLNNIKMNSSTIVYNYFKAKIGFLNQEHFYTLYLDVKKRIIKEKLLFVGTINQSLIHPREIFKEAYLSGATSIICLHNHPSGNVLPSDEDVSITNKLIESGKLLGIKVEDHIIIGKNNYYSFLENGII